MSIAHLTLHTEYSLLDSTIKINDLCNTASKRNISSLSITDLCNIFGSIKFYNIALRYGIKPIFGVHIYILEKNNIFDLYLLAQNNIGYNNIIKLISRSYLLCSRKKNIPIIPKYWLKKLNLSDIFALSGGIWGELGQHLINNDSLTNIDLIIKSYINIFGKNNFIIDIHKINIVNEDKYLFKILDCVYKYKLFAVATNHVRFLDKTDYDNHEIKVGIYEGYTILDEKRISNYTQEQYLKDSNEMFNLFQEMPILLENSLHIAKCCNVTFNFNNIHMPKFYLSSIDEKKYLIKKSHDGLSKRIFNNYNKLINNESTCNIQIYQKRLNDELMIINKMNFASYFLIVSDFILWAKKQNIPVGPGRGSGAGSLVAFALYITDVDPIRYGLIFERFLNIERLSMPDFDIDFCIKGRDKVINYVSNKYGFYNVAQIITYGTLSAKAVIRDVGRVLGYPYGMINKLSKLIPNEIGMKLLDLYESNKELLELYTNDKSVKIIIDKSIQLEGLIRNIGKHAAGVVIAPKVLTSFTAIYTEEDNSSLITQLDKEDVEKIGLIKFDFLGLRNLTIINETLVLINEFRKNNNLSNVNLDHIDLNDKNVFSLLYSGKTIGIFQLESYGMKSLIKKFKPDSFQDIIAILSLYRPGPLGSGLVDNFVKRKNKQQNIIYPHESLKEILSETYGIILYQEQIIKIAQVLANYSLGEADILRRSMCKKDTIEMSKQKTMFYERAHYNNINTDTIDYIFNIMEEFAKYGFNKSHSTAYAIIAYRTAWLKTYYTSFFMAILLSSDMDKTDKLSKIFYECKQLKINIIPPHVNHSNYYFTSINDTEIIYGLGAIKGIGQVIANNIIDIRNNNGKYKDIYDFIFRIINYKINKKVIDSLVYSGSLDNLSLNRASILLNYNKIIQYLSDKNKNIITGQYDCFQDLNDFYFYKNIKIISEFVKNDLLFYEKKFTGLYFSGHVLEYDLYWIKYFNIKLLDEYISNSIKTNITFIVTIVDIFPKKTKNGKMIYILIVDNIYQQFNILIFDNIYILYKDIIDINKNIVIMCNIIPSSDNSKNVSIFGRQIMSVKNYVNINIKEIIITCYYEVVNSDKVYFLLNEINKYIDDSYIPKLITIKILYHDNKIYKTVNKKIKVSIYDIYNNILINNKFFLFTVI